MMTNQKMEIDKTSLDEMEMERVQILRMMSLMVVPPSIGHRPASNDTAIYSFDCVSPQWSSDGYERSLSFKTLALQNAEALGASWRMTRLFNTMMAKNPRVSQHEL
jgi:hypothetical protein